MSIAIVLLVASLAQAAATTAQAAGLAPVTPATEAVARAMVSAVHGRFGGGTGIVVTDVATAIAIPPDGGLEAVPDPDGRSGARVGFTLVATRVSGGRPQAVRIGRASAIVRVWPEQVRMRRFVARGTTMSDDDVELAWDEAAAIVLRRLPTREEVIGARALRDLASGALVANGAVVTQPVVRPGDSVLVTASGPDFQVTAAMDAVEAGVPGAIIHVVNRDSRRTLRARVVSKGVVEIVHE
jgi:flagella basal body P-ring formation protein FlgA